MLQNQIKSTVQVHEEAKKKKIADLHRRWERDVYQTVNKGIVDQLSKQVCAH